MNPLLAIQLATLALGIAEQVGPIFIHNPKSQRIESIIFTDLNAVLSAFQPAAFAAPPVAPAPAPAPVAPAAHSPLGGASYPSK